MAKQLQLRRGTTQANDLFTGANGEVSVDTTTHELRVHDGSTVGGYKVGGEDYVTSYQAPTAENNYTWYRKYKSGWVEQGGFIPANAGTTAVVTTLPVEMADGNYTVLGSVMESYTGTSSGGFNFYDRTTTSFKTNKNNNSRSIMWQVSGMAQG